MLAGMLALQVCLRGIDKSPAFGSGMLALQVCLRPLSCSDLPIRTEHEREYEYEHEHEHERGGNRTAPACPYQGGRICKLL